MTRQEALDILEQPRRKAAQFQFLAEKREELLAQLMPAAPRGERVQKSREDRTARIMAEIMDIEDRMRDVLTERVDAMIRLRRILDTDDPGYTVLSLFYVCGLDMKQISEMLGYKGNYIYKIREVGLDLFSASSTRPNN